MHIGVETLVWPRDSIVLANSVTRGEDPNFCANLYTCCTHIVIFTVRKRSCGKVMFLHLEGERCNPPGRHPPGHPPRQTPPWTDTHSLPGKTSPLDRHPPSRPPPPDGHCSGRYASYWNLFLFSCFLVAAFLLATVMWLCRTPFLFVIE